MRITRAFVAACAVIALVLACVAGDPQGSLSGDDDGYDEASVVDISCVLPACRAEPVLVVQPTGTVFLNLPVPSSHLTPLEIFRPPRARA